ncbi:hypothetical protein BD413DRAFT_105954 [Trametes elegans]|nr:hypothetical protein BD413DRAFT_105954 [Trametes elegans]
MFFNLYTHPRVSVTYEPPANRGSTTRIAVANSSASTRPRLRPTTKDVAVQTSFGAESRAVRRPRRDYVVDREGSCAASSPQDTYGTENVAEALRLKQRMRARLALNTVAELNACGPPQLIPSSPSSSVSSSPASSPPSTPRLGPVDVHSPAQRGRRRDLVAIQGYSSSSAFPRHDESYLADPRARPVSKHRPSRSRSSLLHRSLSRHSSRNAIASPPPPPVTASSSTAAIMDFVKRLAPLPRFNPYRRARAESMSAVVDDNGRHIGGALCGLLARRRCKSEPSTPFRGQ